MRPHIEIVHEDDYVWHKAELPYGDGLAIERRMSVDEEDGSSSLRVDFTSDWHRGRGIHQANTEYYVLSGTMTYGGRRYGIGAYLYAPKGAYVDSIGFSYGTRILHYREYGDATFHRTDRLRDQSSKNSANAAVLIDSETLPWEPVAATGPMAGLSVKYLHVNTATGFYSRLVRASPGWTQQQIEYHPFYEEAYTIDGKVDYNYGTLEKGAYFFRPARVKHGYFTVGEEGATWFMRSDGPTHNWFMDREWVRWGGEAINYGPGGGRSRWSVSSYDLNDSLDELDDRADNGIAAVADLACAHTALGTNTQVGRYPLDPSLTAITAALVGGRDEVAHTFAGNLHADSAPSHFDWGPVPPRDLEHPAERSSADRHNWGQCHPWQQGMSIPVPILSTYPVLTRAI